MKARFQDFLIAVSSASTMCSSLPWATHRTSTGEGILHKKDLSLLVLILVVGAVVAVINPRFLLAGNLSNTLNQVGLFGIFSIAESFVLITRGIELSVGSVIALLGVLFIDLIVNRDVNWVAAFGLIAAGGLLIGFV